MNKIILKYWITDLLIGFVLYLAYVMTIMNSSATGNGLEATILYIADIAINIGFHYYISLQQSFALLLFF